MPSLYDLTNDFQQVQQLIEDGADLQDTLDSIDMAIEDKAENYGKVIRNLEAQARVVKEEKDRLAKKQNTLENGVKDMKRRLFESMQKAGKQKIQSDLFSFNIQKTKSVVNIVDEKSIPKSFHKVTVEYDKTAIIDAIKDGKEIPGVELKAGQTLVIR